MPTDIDQAKHWWYNELTSFERGDILAKYQPAGVNDEWIVIRWKEFLNQSN